MYQAKSAGRSMVQWFTDAMLQRSEKRLALGSALRHAIDRQELSIDYQPEISLRDGRVVGMEALVRWRHPKEGLISPDLFVPVAEETGLILPLGEWVLHTACRECVAIQRQLQRPLTLAVNMSPRQLELEITEGLLMQNPEKSVEQLRQLSKLGVTLVIDDFGTGYSSLAYLTRFPIDKIKIDRSFVRDLSVDAPDAPIVNAIIAMAHSLHIRVIAEGVETEAQQTYLQQRGCDEAQGFYYSKAVAAKSVGSLIEGIGC